MYTHEDGSRCCDTVGGLVAGVFVACALTCVLSALHRIATALMLSARVEVLDELEDDLTPEERELILWKVKARSTRW